MRILIGPYRFESYNVDVVSLNVGRLYSLDFLFENRKDSLNNANNEKQLSPGEKKGLAFVFR